ncbi:hypothetical protein R6Q57_016803 [Mikania cordata]
MAVYIDEDQVWKCIKHPSKRRTGICPKCLRVRLLTLCPNCATARPCTCSSALIDSSSSSSSSSNSFSLFSFSGCRYDSGKGNDETSRLSVDVDPELRKSRSVSISFLRSRSKETDARNDKLLPAKVSRGKTNFWSVFMVNKGKKCDVHDDGSHRTEVELKKSDGVTASDDNPVMMRSRSVAVCTGNRFSSVISRQKGWYFPSPINAFRHPKSPRSITVT